MRLPTFFLGLLAGLAFLLAGMPGADAQGPDPRALVGQFAGKKSYDETEATVKALAATGDPAAALALRALAEGELYFRKSDRAVLVARGGGATLQTFDPLTGDPVGTQAKGSLEKVRVKNSIRTIINAALGSLTLSSPDPARRMSAASGLFAGAMPEQIELLDAMIAKEADPSIKARLQEARASAVLKSDRAVEEKLAAVKTVAARGDRPALVALSALVSAPDPTLAKAAKDGAATIEGRIAL